MAALLLTLAPPNTTWPDDQSRNRLFREIQIAQASAEPQEKLADSLGSNDEPFAALAGPWKVVTDHSEHGAVTGYADIDGDGDLDIALDYPGDRRANTLSSELYLENGAIIGEVSGDVTPPAFTIEYYDYGKFRLDVQGDGQVLAGHWLNAEDKPTGQIRFERLKPDVRSVKVVPNGNGALDYPEMKAIPWDVASNGNKPYVRLDIRGKDLPRYISTDPNSDNYYSNFGYGGCIELQDPTFTYHTSRANSAGTRLRVFFWLNFYPDRSSRPGRKVVTIAGTPVEFDLNFENYETKATAALEALDFRAVDAPDTAAGSELAWGAPFTLTARYDHTPGDDIKRARLYIERDGERVYAFSGAASELLRTPEADAAYANRPLILPKRIAARDARQAAPAKYRFRNGDLLTAELDGVVTKAKLVRRGPPSNEDATELRIMVKGANGLEPAKTSLPQGRVFYVEAHFEEPPTQEKQSIELTWQGNQRTLTAHRVEGGKGLYRTGPLVIERTNETD